MKPYEAVERELAERGPGWWNRVSRWIPELRTLSRIPQPPEYHAEGDVGAHTRLAVEACPPDCEPDLLWAALLHDLGKVDTTREEGDRITAHGHARASAERGEQVLSDLGLPAERRERILWAVRNHMFHLSWHLVAPEQASRRHRRFAADERFPLLLELLRADSAASVGNPRGMEAYELYSRLRRMIDTDEARGAQSETAE